MAWLFNLSPDRVNVPTRDWSGIDTLAQNFQQKRADAKTGAAVNEFASGLDPEVAKQVAPLLRDPQTRDAGLRMIMERTKRPQFDVQIAPDGTPLRINEQEGTIEAIGKTGQYARPREVSQADRNTPEARAATAVQYGLDPNSEEGRRYILTGSLPAGDRGVTAGDREAIRESDDLVASGENALGLLKKAKALSATAYEGPYAAERAKVAATLSGDQGALDTQNFDNILTENSLGQMKAIFGGNPTEGERAILLEIQGASNKPKKVREEILDRAIGLVEKRIAKNRARAEDLRGGTYYKPNAAPGAAPADAPKRRKYNPATGAIE